MTWVLIDKEKKVTNAYDFFLDPACVLCLAGSIGFVVALAGWIGALRDAIEALQIVSKCISPHAWVFSQSVSNSDNSIAKKPYIFVTPPPPTHTHTSVSAHGPYDIRIL